MKRSNKRKKLLWTALILLVLICLGMWGASYVLLRRTPDWYQPDTSTPDQRSKAAKAFEDILASIHNWGGHHAIQARARLPVQGSHLDPTTQQARAVLGQKPDEAVQISFTDDELNAFFNKWADGLNRREWINQYVQDPRLVLRENQLIIVGKIKQWDLVVSLIFEPKLDAQGRLNMNLTHVLGGVLPLPDAMWSGTRNSMEDTLRSKLPAYQTGAMITPEGVANGDAGSAAMNQLLLAMLHYKPASPVIFIPLDARLSQNLPVKITSVAVHDHTLEMTAEQMSEEERQSFLSRLKGETQLEPAETTP